jgi:polar amino acid transport system permease protein
MLDDLLAPKYLQWLFDGFVVTVVLSALTCVFATLLGFALCLGRLARSPLLSLPVRSFLSLFRNTPLLVQLFFWYFGAAALIPEGAMQWLNEPHHWRLPGFDLAWPPFEYVAGFFGLTLYTATFIAEEFRAGLGGVGRGQTAAAQALGMRGHQVWLYVIMPQAVRISLPPLLGQYMNAIKNSSMTMAIGVAELSYASRQVETETFKTFQAFGIATALYILLIVLIELAGQWVQRRRLAH